jgi:hypothetical protein
MAHGEDRMLYVLERDGSIVYCSSFAVASALLETGWILRDSSHWPMLVEDLAADLPPSTRDDPV